MFPPSQIIILSPDAPEPLSDLEVGKLYVIGGLLDESKKSPAVFDAANKNNIISKRLPIKGNWIKKQQK